MGIQHAGDPDEKWLMRTALRADGKVAGGARPGPTDRNVERWIDSRENVTNPEFGPVKPRL
jgi:hypothetical protein